MSATPTKIRRGTLQASSGQRSPTFKALVRAHAELTTKFIALLNKLDADSGVGDTDFESSLTPSPRVVD